MKTNVGIGVPVSRSQADQLLEVAQHGGNGQANGELVAALVTGRRCVPHHLVDEATSWADRGALLPSLDFRTRAMLRRLSEKLTGSKPSTHHRRPREFAHELAAMCRCGRTFGDHKARWPHPLDERCPRFHRGRPKQVQL